MSNSPPHDLPPQQARLGLASIFGSTFLELTGYFMLAPLLIVAVLWFWVDLNEELADLPPWRPLPLTVRIWRWCWPPAELWQSRGM